MIHSCASNMPHCFSSTYNCHHFFFTDNAHILQSFDIRTSFRIFLYFKFWRFITRIMQKISQRLFVNFKHLNSNWVFNLKILISNMIKDLPTCPRYNTHLSFIKYIFSIHRESLTTSCLTVCKYCPIVSFHYIFNHRSSNNIENLLLSGFWLEYVIKCKSIIATVCMEFILKFYSLAILIEIYHFLAFRV